MLCCLWDGSLGASQNWSHPSSCKLLGFILSEHSKRALAFYSMPPCWRKKSVICSWPKFLFLIAVCTELNKSSKRSWNFPCFSLKLFQWNLYRIVFILKVFLFLSSETTFPSRKVYWNCCGWLACGNVYACEKKSSWDRYSPRTLIFKYILDYLIWFLLSTKGVTPHLLHGLDKKLSILLANLSLQRKVWDTVLNLAVTIRYKFLVCIPSKICRSFIAKTTGSQKMKVLLSLVFLMSFWILMPPASESACSCNRFVNLKPRWLHKIKCPGMA